MASSGLSGTWNRLPTGAKWGLLAGTALILALAVWLSVVLLTPDYKVLFSDLSQRDAAVIVEQLKQSKTKYRLADEGTTITVPAEHVHDVRLHLMSSELPLSGGVGFEIFDKQGLGATENSQRVSYQRALQGELTRTISTLENVKQVRVHLVLPESSLFRKDRQEATAAVTLSVKPGAALERQQILGVQRLIAASVPGLTPERVIVTDHRGVTLSAAEQAGVGAGAAESRLEIKRQIEEYVTRKVAHLLDSAYGPGQAIVSVDAALSFDATKRTIQDLVPATNANGELEGRVVRKRQVLGGAANDATWTNAAEGAATQSRPSGSSLEIEYEYGRRMEEVITAPGTVTRLSIGVIVPEAISDAAKVKIKEIVRAAAGIDEVRGDAISVQSLLDFGGPAEAAAHPDATVNVEAAEPSPSAVPAAAPRRAVPWSSTMVLSIGGAILVAIVLLLLVRRLVPRRLSASERDRLLREIQSAVNDQPGATRASSQS